MPKRYEAPKHVSSIHCPSGNEYRVNGGSIQIPDKAAEGDHVAAVGAGFKPVDGEHAAAESTSAGKSPKKA